MAKNLQQEQKEINVLLNQGFKIEVTRTELRFKDGIRGFFESPEDVEVKEIYEFKEPTLAVLDLATEQYLALAITEAEQGDSEKVIKAAHKTLKDNARKMARIAAIFSLGEKCFQKDGDRYEIMEDVIEKRTEILFHWATPAKLERLVSLCTALSNLPDFLNTIRSIGASRTTKPADLVG